MVRVQEIAETLLQVAKYKNCHTIHNFEVLTKN